MTNPNGRPINDEITTLHKTITRNLNYRMQEMELLAIDLARLSGFTPPMVGRWLKGKAVPGWVALVRLAKVLHVKPVYFLNTLKANREAS